MEKHRTVQKPNTHSIVISINFAVNLTRQHSSKFDGRILASFRIAGKKENLTEKRIPSLIIF